MNWPEFLSQYVQHYSARTEAHKSETTSKNPENFIRLIDSDLGRSVSFNRIAIHHVILPPGSRSSYPHAESTEEEFVVVLQGEPHLWLNGYIHELKEGFAVGFPAGTGIAHTLINNTESEVHLLVAGDKTKTDNLCAFPIDSELRESSPIWWDSAPRQKLGPHRGLPGPLRDVDKAQTPSPYILNCLTQGRRKPFHYPGDNETFGEGFRLTDHIGLKNLGISYDILPPGARSSFPHAHTHEEEFVYILKGEATIWLDGFTKKIGPGYYGAFPSNTGLAHTLLNNSDEDMIYLCIGETQDFPDEKISYPLNPLRQAECGRKGWYWNELKRPVSGTASAQPLQSKKEHIAFQICGERELEQILSVLKKCSASVNQIYQNLLSINQAKRLLNRIPTNSEDEKTRELLLVKRNSEAVGLIDLHTHKPEQESCQLELFLIADDFLSQEFIDSCQQLFKDYALRAHGCKDMKITDSAKVTHFKI